MEEEEEGEAEKKRNILARDDGGSFNAILREVQEVAKGDESLKQELLTHRVLQNLITKKWMEKGNIPSTSDEEAVRKLENRTKVDNLGFCTPKKKVRIRRLPRTPATFLTRCYQGRNSEEEEEEEEEVNRRQNMQKKSKKNETLAQQPPLHIPQDFKKRIEEMNGTHAMFVMEKKITDTDLSKNNNRLSMPKNKISASDFLTPEEKNKLDEKQGLKVLLIPPSLQDTTTLELKKWKMKNTFCYNLIGKWYSSVVQNQSNGLRKGSSIQLWSFRKDSQLCFALMKIRSRSFHDSPRYGST